MQIRFNYHYQSKICESPFPRLNYLEPLARTPSNLGRRSSCKLKTQDNGRKLFNYLRSKKQEIIK